MDDLLLAAEDQRGRMRGTEHLLHTLGELGPRASAKKVRICQRQTTYLEYVLKEQQRCLSEAHKEIVLKIPNPKSAKQSKEFLVILPPMDPLVC